MPGLIALVDIGSNATRFFLARVETDAGFHIVADERVQTRLGAGARRRLPRGAIDRTVTAVHHFLGRLPRIANGEGRPRVLAVATAAVRDAANRDQLQETLRRREGIELRVLSGEEEGRLGA